MAKETLSDAYEAMDIELEGLIQLLMLIEEAVEYSPSNLTKNIGGALYLICDIVERQKTRLEQSFSNVAYPNSKKATIQDG